MRRLFALLLVAWFGTIGTSAAEVRLTIRDGLVTLNASDASVAEILAEWAKVGQTQIVNGELVAGELVSIELTDLPERQALDVVLQSVAGYIAVSRPAGMVAASLFDRILILPTSTPPRVAAPTGPTPVPQSEYQHYSQDLQDPPVPPAIEDDSPVLATPNPSGAAVASYPAYQPAPPVPAGSRVPGQMPPGTRAPGMPVQPAPQTPPAYPSNPIQNP